MKGESVYNTGAGGIYKGVGIYENEETPPTNTIIIDGEEYPYIEINGLYWITKNLNTMSIPYFTPPEIADENGQLYKAYYLDDIENMLPTGWRVPTHYDFTSCFGALSQNSNDYISTDIGGNDIYGFNLPLPGYRNTNGNKVYGGSRCLLWSKDQKDGTHNYNAAFIINYHIDLSDWSAGTILRESNTALSVRVCKTI